MASTTITAKLKLIAEGLKEAVKDSGIFSNNLDRAAQNAQRIKVPPQSSGRSMASVMQDTQYNAARGTAGVTGAAARDFAKQAEGLGGLVRLYATYAANIYAAGAAFRALSAAMDTANMVKGLDQLGAASGVALGSLSKRLVSATDGAISLREAMEATAKASSSGMNSEQILRMGKAAKQASQALGVDMQDAVSRITRGITKLEPELLDEIGIFVKVGDTTAEYAKSVGKAATQLTDFEKRQAFANAVLDQADKKFSSIDIDTNPYVQLSAAMKDLTQSGLELVNTVLGPIIRYLGQSPTTLALGIAAFASMIVKQAIPEITKLRENIASMGETAILASKQKYEAVTAYAKKEAQVLKAIADDAAERASMEFEETSKRIQTIHSTTTGNIKRWPKELEEISKKSVIELKDDPKALAILDKYARKGTIVSQLYKQLADNIKAYGKEHDKSIAKMAEIEADFVKQRQVMEAKYQKESAQGLQEAFSRQSRSQAANIATTVGLKEAFKDLAQSLKAARNGAASVSFEVDEVDASGKRTTKTVTEMIPKFGLLATSIGAVGGAFSILGATVSKALAVAAPWLEAIGLVIVAVGAIDAIFSKASKSINDFKAAVEASTEASENLAKTIDYIKDKDPSKVFEVQSLSAQSKALQELVGSVDQLSKTAEKAIKDINASSFDSFKNKFFSMFGGGAVNNFKDSLAETLSSAVSELDNSPLSTNIRKDLQAVLGLEDLDDKKALRKALDAKNIEPGSKALEQVRKALKGTATDFGIVTSKSEEFIASLKKSEEAYKTYADQYKITDPLSNLAAQQLESLGKLDSVLKEDITKSVGSLVALMESTQSISLFGEAAKDVLAYKQQVIDLNKQIGEYTQAAVRARDKIKEIESGASYAQAKATSENMQVPKPDREAAAKLIADAEQKIAENRKAALAAEASAAKARSELVPIAAAIQTKIPGALALWVGNIEKGIVSALAKGSTEFIQNLYSKAAEVTSDPEMVRREYSLKLQEISSQKSLIQSNIDLITQLKINAAQQAANLAFSKLQMDVQLAIARGVKTGDLGTDATIQASSKTYTEAYNRAEALKSAVAKPQGATTRAQELAESGQLAKDAVIEVSEVARQVAGLRVELNSLIRQEQATILEGKLKEYDVEQNKINKLLETRVKEIGLDKQSLVQQKERGLITSEEFNIKSQALDTAEQNIKYAQTSLKIDYEKIKANKIADTFSANGLKTDAERVRQSAESSANLEYNIALRTRNQAMSQLEIDAANQTLKITQDELSFQQELVGIRQEGTDALKDADIEARSAVLEQAKLGKKFTEEYLIDQEYRAKLVAIAEDTKRKQFAQTAQFQMKQSQLVAEFDSEMKKSGGQDTQRSQEIVRLLEAEEEANTNKLRGLVLTRNAQVDIAKATRDAALEQLNYNSTVEKLNTLFGDLAPTLISVVDAFKQAADSQKQYANTLADLENQKASEKDPRKIALIEEKIAETRELGAKAELTGIAKTAVATKKLFKEKTAAYKIFNAVEKTSQAVSLALELKTAAVKIATWMGLIPAKVTSEAALTTAEASGAAARAPLTYGEIIGQYLKSIPAPWGMVAGVAAGAFFLSLLGGSGGGKKGGGFVPTAEQRQETQGTAMSYDSNGKLVQTRAGVFGDTSAKSESISKLLESIKSTSVEGLSYYNKMVKALEGIRTAIEGSAKSLYRITGLSTGSIFGTAPTSTSTSGITGLFGSSTTKEITDSGLKLKGTFLELASGAGGVVEMFETIKKTKKSSGFLGLGSSTKVSFSTKTTDLGLADPKAMQQVQAIFGYGANLLGSLADLAGVATPQLEQAMASVNVDEMVSLRGLKGEEFTKELESVFGAILDDVAGVAFSSFAEFQKFGEGMLETVGRVVDTNSKVKQALENMGESTSRLSQYTFKVTENLVTAAGGLETFLDKASYFVDNFLSEAERTAISQKSVSKTFADLNKLYPQLSLTVPKTRNEFKNLILGLDKTTTAGVATYTALMDVAPAFIDVTEAANSALESLKSSLESFIEGITKYRNDLLLGSQSTLTPEEKYLEARRQYDVTVANLTSEDLKTAEKARTDLQGVSSAFLEASRVYNSSSSQYTADFQTVLTTLDQAQANAQTTLTLAEQQLGATETTNALLTNIDLGISTLAKIPTATVQAAATGGWRQGITLVGEQGPELVDFTKPARVYTADQTNGMFSPANNNLQVQKALVEEVKALRQEVAQLRKDQQQQTGDLIMSNYDANQKASEEIASAVASGSQEMAWATRSAPVIK